MTAVKFVEIFLWVPYDNILFGPLVISRKIQLILSQIVKYTADPFSIAFQKYCLSDI